MKDETAAFINRAIGMQVQIPRMDYEFAVILKENNELIGGCGIHISEPLQGEIGYCFNASYWRNGYASESAAALLKFGFSEPDYIAYMRHVGQQHRVCECDEKCWNAV